MSATADGECDNLTVTIGHDEDESVVVVRGELDFHSARLLSGAIAEAADRHRPVVVDCTHLTVIDSVGLRVLLRADKLWGHDPGFSLRASPDQPVCRLLESH